MDKRKIMWLLFKVAWFFSWWSLDALMACSFSKNTPKSPNLDPKSKIRSLQDLLKYFKNFLKEIFNNLIPYCITGS